MKFKFHEDYRYWEIALAASVASKAEAGFIWSHWNFAANPDPRMHGPAQCGYWKRRVRGVWTPVLIYKDDAGVLMIMTGAAEAIRLTDDNRAWEWCEPIDYDTYMHAFRDGRFPGELTETGPKLDGNLFDPGADFRDQMISLVGKIEEFMRQNPPPLTEAIASAYANYLDMLRQAEKNAQEIVSKEIVEAKAQIKQRKSLWETSIGAVSTASRAVRDLLTPYLKERKAEGIEAKIGGQSGNRVSLRPTWTARVDDWELVYPEFSEHPKVRELILTLLKANARSKGRDALEVPGATYYTEDQAV